MKTIYISGTIGYDVTANDIREQVDPKSKEKLRVIINSPGGLVGDGFEIYNILSAYKGELEIIIGVMAASVAAYIAMAAPVENRKSFKNSSMMQHEASSLVMGGRARDFKIVSERLEGLNNIQAEAFANGMNITKEQALKNIEEDFYMTGWEALLDNNIISDIIDLEDVEIPQKEEDDDFGFIFMKSMEEDLKCLNDVATIKAVMYETEEKILLDKEKSKIDFKKAVACLNEFNPEKTPVKNKINVEEDTMSLQDYLKSNSDALAEYETAISTAKEEERIKMSEIMKEDQERIAEILTLENVSISENAVKAITGDMTVNEYMKEELMKQKEIRQKTKPSVFGGLVAKQIPGEQDAGSVKDVQIGMSLDDFDKKLEEAKEKTENRSVM